MNITPPINYVLNGNFSTTSCGASYCLYNINSYTNQVSYWKPQPEI